MEVSCHILMCPASKHSKQTSAFYKSWVKVRLVGKWGVCVSYQVFHTLVHCIRHTNERLLFTSVMASSAMVPSVWHTITVFLCSHPAASVTSRNASSEVLHFSCTCIVKPACHKLVVHTWRWQIMHAQQAHVKTAAAPPPRCHKEDSSRGQMAP